MTEQQKRLLGLHGWYLSGFGVWAHPLKSGFWLDPWPILLKEHPEIERVYMLEVTRHV